MAEKQVAVIEVKHPELVVAALKLAEEALEKRYENVELSDADRVMIALARGWVFGLQTSIEEQL